MMKKLVPLAFSALILASTTGCRNYSCCGDIVKETFVHKYGVPISQNDWIKNGKDGQIVHLNKNGVTVTTNFEKGVQHGDTTHSFPNNSTIQSILTYNLGTLVSKIVNYPSGVPQKKECYENAYVTKVVSWYEDGTPTSIESFEGKTLVAAEFRTPMNVVEARVENAFGTRLIRGKNGRVVAEDKIENGQMSLRTTFFSDGEPKAVTPYLDGHIHGTRLTYTEGGLPYTIESWENGLQEGITSSFRNGEKTSDTPYIRGKKHGIELCYRDGKMVAEEVTWQQGIQHGPRKIIAEDISTTEWYHQGNLVSRNTYERMNLR